MNKLNIEIVSRKLHSTKLSRVIYLARLSLFGVEQFHSLQLIAKVKRKLTESKHKNVNDAFVSFCC